MKILFVNRFLKRYRYDLLKGLASDFDQVSFLAVDRVGSDSTGQSYRPEKQDDKVRVCLEKGFPLRFPGDTRTTQMVLISPFAIAREINEADIVITEGTSNILNNLLVAPIARFKRKKLIWWDAGYSPEFRTVRRKTIDCLLRPLVRLSHAQLAYSTKARRYMSEHMAASNCHLLVNTIDTSFFAKIQNEIVRHNRERVFDENKVKLLFVGVIEKRKKIDDLIDMVVRLNSEGGRRYFLTIVGDGPDLGLLKYKRADSEFLAFEGPVYELERLKDYYFNADFFTLPGDGGLGLLQALLFGCPALCVSADGTEEDYFDRKDYIKNDLSEIETHLRNVSASAYQRIDVTALMSRISTERFQSEFVDIVKNL